MTSKVTTRWVARRAPCQYQSSQFGLSSLRYALVLRHRESFGPTTDTIVKVEVAESTTWKVEITGSGGTFVHAFNAHEAAVFDAKSARERGRALAFPNYRVAIYRVTRRTIRTVRT